jgi:DNA-binding GntR family transcriptional regulator
MLDDIQTGLHSAIGRNIFRIELKVASGGDLVNGSIAAGELMADQAYDRLVAALTDGRLASGQFVTMPGLVDMLALPIAATREAVKRADVNGLVEVMPKRGVLIMEATPAATRDCMDLRALLDQEGARRLIAADAAMPLAALRASHEALIAAAEHEMTPDLPRRAVLTDLSLHDMLATGLANPLAAAAYRVNRDRIAVIQNTRSFLPDRIVPAMREHLTIIEALERRDAEAAVAALDFHFRLTLRWWGILL